MSAPAWYEGGSWRGAEAEKSTSLLSADSGQNYYFNIYDPNGTTLADTLSVKTLASGKEFLIDFAVGGVGGVPLSTPRKS